MNGQRIWLWTPMVAVVLATVALTWTAVSTWQTEGEDRSLADGVGLAEAGEAAVPFATAIERHSGPGQPAELQGEWPWFRGPMRTGQVVDPKVTLLTRWPDGGPAVKWRLPLGEGYGGPAVKQGTVYLLDHDPKAKRDLLRAHSLADGQEIWRTTYPVRLKRNFGYSRTVPAVGEDFVVSIGPGGHVLAASPATGEVLWTVDLVADYSAKIPNWYNGQCPLVDGNKVILAPAGSALLVALDGRSGKVLWKTPNQDEWPMTHASVGVAEFGGERLYIYPSGKGLVGVHAQTGAVRFADSSWKVRVSNIPTPLFVAPDRLFVTGGYEAGSRFSTLVERDGKLALETLWEADSDQFGSHIQTPLFVHGCFVGVGENSRLTCLGEDGKNRWDTGPEREYGTGPYIQVNDLLYALTDKGELTLLRPHADRVETLASAKILKGPDAWSPMAYVDGLLLVRDPVELLCLQVGE